MFIGQPDRLPAVVERAGAAGAIDGEVLEFSDADALQALESDRQAAAAGDHVRAVLCDDAARLALITRIKADPKLDDSEIRVLAR